ncbi:MULTISPECIES: homing endonuclease associated repeat-containing protein [Bacillus]|uniref:homing endonuclease associated repeat-containing protein n=1 Tax=Bacillus TaxID=1386 RepID=UPI000BEE1251|nr:MULTISPECIES: hypothetical protein [Bacillus]PED47357.1 hypothetical protein CON49_23985 [Bacillus cereus]PFI69583.1 hypothetical protein COI82_16360 [Bacillus cereus]PFO49025.1 hypothetical protein COJ74_29475 [Bacillus cereus]PFP65559.1 hypothetical protein COJ99_25700 [Bacillus cereus]PFQ17919.1 hypothetical protein COK13_25420 [Bacillus cereus]
MELKLCRNCNTTKPILEFNKCKSNKDGLQKYCRTCTKRFSRQNKEKKALLLGRVMKSYEEKKFSNITEDDLIYFLKKFYIENGRPPTTYDFEDNPQYPSSKTYYRHFKYRKNKKEQAHGWNSILTLAGIKPLDYDLIWMAWEYLVELTIQKLEDDYIFQSTAVAKGYRPDVVIPSKKLIIDAATSNYDSIHKVKQFYKAKSKGYKVEYWCLYKTTKNGIDEPELTYVFSDEIAKRLRDVGELKIANDIESLLQRHDNFADEIIKHKKFYIAEQLLKLAHILKRTPQTRDLINRPNFPSATTVTKIFGTFNEALQFAGLEITREKLEPYEKDIAINDIISLTNKLGRIPKVREVGQPNTTYSEKVYFKHFGGIYECLRKQGFNIESMLKKEKQEEIDIRVEQVKKFKELHKRYPKQVEFRIKNNLPSYHWIYDQFW